MQKMLYDEIECGLWKFKFFVSIFDVTRMVLQNSNNRRIIETLTFKIENSFFFLNREFTPIPKLRLKNFKLLKKDIIKLLRY